MNFIRHPGDMNLNTVVTSLPTDIGTLLLFSKYPVVSLANVVLWFHVVPAVFNVKVAGMVPTTVVRVSAGPNRVVPTLKFVVYSGPVEVCVTTVVLVCM